MTTAPLPDGVFGDRLTVNFRGERESISAVSDPVNVAAFARNLVKRINMIAYGEPQTPRFADHDPDAAGITLVQLITTSDITAHFVERTGDGYVSVFSCAAFDAEPVMDAIEEYFHAGDMTARWARETAPALGSGRVVVDNR